MALLLAGGLSIAALPMLLLYLAIIVLFLWLVYFILSKLPAPIGTYAWWVVVVLAGIILLIFLINLAGGGTLG